MTQAAHQTESHIIRTLVSLSLGLPLLSIAWLLMDPEAASHATKLAACLTHCLYWATGPLATVMLALVLLLGLGARGHSSILARQKPSFSRHAWLAMLLTAGLGSSLVFWAGLEPARLLSATGASVTAERALAALAQAQFHWGVHAWVWALVCALLIGMRARGQSPSNLYSHRLARPQAAAASRRSLRTLVDLALLLGAVFGLLATLPLGARLITDGIAQLTGLGLGPPAAAVTLILVTLAAGASALAGLTRGIRPVALATSLLLLALLVAVWIGGGALAGAKLVIASLGESASQLPGLSFSTAPFAVDASAGSSNVASANLTDRLAESLNGSLAGTLANTGNGNWQGDWLQQDFIRWVVSAPLVGMFIAGISRGRTVRELLLAGLLVPALVGLIWIGLVGGLVLRPAVAGSLPLDAASLEALGVWGLFQHLPLAPAMLTLALLTALGLLIALLDSSIHALAAMTTSAGRKASWRLRLYWSLAVGLLSLGFLLIHPPRGDLVAQASALLFGVGTLIAMLALSLCTARTLLPAKGSWISPTRASGLAAESASGSAPAVALEQASKEEAVVVSGVVRVAGAPAVQGPAEAVAASGDVRIPGAPAVPGPAEAEAAAGDPSAPRSRQAHALATPTVLD